MLRRACDVTPQRTSAHGAVLTAGAAERHVGTLGRRDAPRIELAGVSKRFGAVEALAPVDLDVARRRGRHGARPVGQRQDDAAAASSAGWSSRRPGAVAVDGSRPRAARAAKQIGFVPQSPALLPWRTVAENARLLLDVNRRRHADAAGPSPDELLDEVGLAEFAGA